MYILTDRSQIRVVRNLFDLSDVRIYTNNSYLRGYLYIRGSETTFNYAIGAITSPINRPEWFNITEFFWIRNIYRFAILIAEMIRNNKSNYIIRLIEDGVRNGTISQYAEIANYYLKDVIGPVLKNERDIRIICRYIVTRFVMVNRRNIDNLYMPNFITMYGKKREELDRRTIYDLSIYQMAVRVSYEKFDCSINVHYIYTIFKDNYVAYEKYTSIFVDTVVEVLREIGHELANC